MLENDVLMEKSTVQMQQEEASEEYIKQDVSDEIKKSLSQYSLKVYPKNMRT